MAPASQPVARSFPARRDSSCRTKIGRIKIDILGVKKEIEEKMLELGGRVYDRYLKSKSLNFEMHQDIQSLINDIEALEKELKKCEQDLQRIKKLEDTSFIEKK